MSRNVTAEPVDPAERFAVYRLCECERCRGTGKTAVGTVHGQIIPGSVGRCSICRGEGRVRQAVGYCATPEDLGAALYHWALEGEFEECPIGILDRIPEPGNPKWLVKPWLPSARNVSDAGRTLARSKHGR